MQCLPAGGETAVEPHPSGEQGGFLMEQRTASPYVAGPLGSSASKASPDRGKPPATGSIVTGYGSCEPSIAIAGDGTIFLAPVHTPEGNGLLSSRDNGATWQVLIPRFDGGSGHKRVQPFLYMDPDTERLFFHTGRFSFMPPKPRRGFDMSWSDDQGDTWNHVVVAPDAFDWLKVYSGAARIEPHGRLSQRDLHIRSHPDIDQVLAASLSEGPASLSFFRRWQDLEQGREPQPQADRHPGLPASRVGNIRDRSCRRRRHRLPGFQARPSPGTGHQPRRGHDLDRERRPRLDAA